MNKKDKIEMAKEAVEDFKNLVENWEKKYEQILETDIAYSLSVFDPDSFDCINGWMSFNNPDIARIGWKELLKNIENIEKTL